MAVGLFDFVPSDMTKPIIDFSNLDMPVAVIIRDALSSLAQQAKTCILESMSEDEFIEHRVDIYLQQVESAFITGNSTPSGAEEYALDECLAGLR